MESSTSDVTRGLKGQPTIHPLFLLFCPKKNLLAGNESRNSRYFRGINLGMIFNEGLKGHIYESSPFFLSSFV